MAAEIGSISSGTLRSEDLLEAFADELERLTDGEAPEPVGEARALLDKGPENWTDEDEEAASWLVNEDLPDALNERAPEFCYFGAHPGDGADFGFWISDDAIRDGIHDDEILSVEDGRNAERRCIPQFVYHVNDHGNATLYRIHVEEVWSVV